jgi:hypothetical protein
MTARQESIKMNFANRAASHLAALARPSIRDVRFSVVAWQGPRDKQTPAAGFSASRAALT